MFNNGFDGFDGFDDSVGKGKGKDIEVDILLSLEESLNGCKKELKIESVKRDLNCNDCSGSGKDVNGKKIPCKSCAGHGKIISSRKHVMNVITCDVCNGLGVLFISSCKTCHGSGKTKSIKFVSIFIPPGVEAGQKLRIQGKGNFIENGEPGDLYVTIYVDQREECSRIGDNLKIIHYTPIIDFLIGLKQNIKLPNGSNVNIDILPGMQPDHEVIVKGAGATNIKTKNKGDLIVVLKAILPSTLTPRARKLVEELKIEFNKTNH
jgi:molecular chaperone DnaJ